MRAWKAQLTAYSSAVQIRKVLQNLHSNFKVTESHSTDPKLNIEFKDKFKERLCTGGLVLDISNLIENAYVYIIDRRGSVG